MLPNVTLTALHVLLSRNAYRYTHEIQLHDGVAIVLAAAGITFRREVELDAKSRADFVIDGGVVVEVKIDGTLGSALHQARRYAHAPGVSGVLLASACTWARNTPPDIDLSSACAPIRLAYLRRQAL